MDLKTDIVENFPPGDKGKTKDKSTAKFNTDRPGRAAEKIVKIFKYADSFPFLLINIGLLLKSFDALI